MENFCVKPDEIIEILKKRYQEKYGEKSYISEEDINNFVINSEKDRFNDLFNKVFEEDILPCESEDCEDGPINEICLKIISEIKHAFEKVDKEKLIKFCFRIIRELLLKKEE